jgi:EAL domain-containing protein (putative c-di-GMP-specific phosphodiesterase class I)
LIIPPNAVTRYRIAAGLALAEVEALERTDGALHVAVDGLDYKALLEAVGAALSAGEKFATKIAVIPRWADERGRLRAIVAARPLSHLLEEYSASWICGVLRRNALQVHFQPLVQYPPGRVHAYECLLRGVSEDGRLIGPARLFGAAASLGMAYLLDDRSTRAAVAAAGAVGFSSTQYFINLMAAAISDPAAGAESMREAVEGGGLSAGQITFELVDAESCRDRGHLLAVVEAYRDAGFRISLDDVGAGGASLLSLEDLRPDYVKLDAGLCRHAPASALEGELMHDLVEAARQQGIVAVAKGIETIEQLRFAMEAGVRVTQGFVHAKPAAVPLDLEAEEKLLERVRGLGVGDSARKRAG